jgi:benzoate transport
MTEIQPKAIIDSERMSALQWVAVAITVGLNGLDGFDVLSIGFASPQIAKAWGVSQATLGWLLSMELFGMGAGSMVLGGVADKIGRRPVMLGCLLAMMVGMYGAAHSNGVDVLLAWRLLTGLGIGGMLATTNAAVAEYANARWRPLALAFMVAGYPLGGTLGGIVVHQLLASGSWRDIFTFGAAMAAVFVPLLWLFAPESVAFLDRRRPHDALERINRALVRFGHAPMARLPPGTAARRRASLTDILRPGLAAATLLITLAYFTHYISFYFLLKWAAKITVDSGFTAQAAAGVLTFFNLGGVIGIALFGVAALRFRLKPLLLISLSVAGIAVIAFGYATGSLTGITATATLAGWMDNASMVGLYSLFATVFPTHVRATGTGFAIGIGRSGAMLAPVIAGYLFQAGLTVKMVAPVMSLGSFVAALALLLLRVPDRGELVPASAAAEPGSLSSAGSAP